MQKFLLILLSVAALAVILTLFLLSPRPGARKRKKFQPFLRRMYAHRGVFDNVHVPENSLPAFLAAVDRSLGIELDIHRTADGEVVVFHDDTLTRMCGDDRRVEDCTLAQLRALRLAGTDETIPTLTEVLTAVGGRVPLIVELKGETGDTRLCDAAMPILENSGTPYCVESFNPLLTWRYKRLAPHVMRGILSTRFARDGMHRGALGFLLTHLMLNFLARPDFIAERHPYGKFFPVRLCRALGAATFAWTVRTREEYLACAADFDAFICENVDELLKK